MDILLVEDRALDADILSGQLQQLGHTVTVSNNGDDALVYFTHHRPDLVVASAFVPGLDGFALTRAIQLCAAPRWQPVVVISSECEETLQVRAIEAGADAFFVKPIANASLSARLQVIDRLLRMQDEAAAHLTRIGAFMVAEEEDLRVARHLIEHQMSGDGARFLDDPAVQYWRRSCSRLGGDMFSVSRAPNGVLHAMLADATGNGLAAYVTLLPIISPFYRMTEKGYPLATIVRELNLKARQALPANRVVAVQLVAVDTREGIVSVWNGGMPTAFMLDGFGHHFQEFSLNHSPLGLLDDTNFDDRIEQHAFTRGEQLVMVSDGLLDAHGTSGSRFGEQGLANALVGLPRSQRLDEVVASILAHIDGQEPDDDMTLVLIDCEKSAAAHTVTLPHMPPSRQPGNWCFSLRLGANELGHADVVPLLLNVASQFHAPRDCTGELFVILSELYNNALDHGVLRLDSQLKLSPDGMETWLLLREERLAQLVEGEICLLVEQTVTADGVWLRICCRDSGPGFDVRAAIEKSGEIQSHHSVLTFGRGLALVQSMAQSVTYSTTGNEVTVLLALDGKTPLPH
jgi:CheY-like chemotaxis protein/anti-sigma regulatory factor (Ser/Thr protein kinase)